MQLERLVTGCVKNDHNVLWGGERHLGDFVIMPKMFCTPLTWENSGPSISQMMEIVSHPAYLKHSSKNSFSWRRTRRRTFLLHHSEDEPPVEDPSVKAALDAMAAMARDANPPSNVAGMASAVMPARTDQSTCDYKVSSITILRRKPYMELSSILSATN